MESEFLVANVVCMVVPVGPLVPLAMALVGKMYMHPSPLELTLIGHCCVYYDMAVLSYLSTGLLVTKSFGLRTEQMKSMFTASILYSALPNSYLPSYMVLLFMVDSMSPMFTPVCVAIRLFTMPGPFYLIQPATFEKTFFTWPKSSKAIALSISCYFSKDSFGKLGNLVMTAF